VLSIDATLRDVVDVCALLLVVYLNDDVDGKGDVDDGS
jgi:hypothetical protein